MYLIKWPVSDIYILFLSVIIIIIVTWFCEIKPNKNYSNCC